MTLPIRHTGNRVDEVRQINLALNDLVEQLNALGLQVLPAGGSSGFMLVKASAADYDTEWVEPAGTPENVILTGDVTLDLDNVASGTVYSSSSGAGVTISLPSVGSAAHNGKQIHIVSNSTFSQSITVQHVSGSNGLIRNSSGGSAPFTVTNGRLTLTIVEGAFSSRWYSAAGDWS